MKQSCPIKQENCPLLVEQPGRLDWLRSNWFSILMTILWTLTFLSQINGWAFTQTNTDYSLRKDLDLSKTILEHHMSEDISTFARKDLVEQQFRFITEQLSEIKTAINKKGI